MVTEVTSSRMLKGKFYNGDCDCREGFTAQNTKITWEIPESASQINRAQCWLHHGWAEGIKHLKSVKCCPHGWKMPHFISIWDLRINNMLSKKPTLDKIAPAKWEWASKYCWINAVAWINAAAPPPHPLSEKNIGCVLWANLDVCLRAGSV